MNLESPMDAAGASMIDAAAHGESTSGASGRDEANINATARDESKIDAAAHSESKSDAAAHSESKSDAAARDESTIDTAAHGESKIVQAAHIVAKIDSSSWNGFVDRLASTGPRHTLPPPLRAMAQELAGRTLALLFTQFAREVRVSARDVRAEAKELESLLRDALGFVLPAERVGVVALEFLNQLPHVHDALEDDAMAILSGDPAAASREEVIQAYPGFLATAVHRLAHELYTRNVPVLPRLLSEWSHRETGIDIHPGATIGRSFAVDHGTGVVIGESSLIGTGVRIYQGVTLGALAVSKRLAHKKRHPTIGNDVVIYANATILGGQTEIGDGSIIGGNVWLTHSVPPRSIVQFTSRIEQRSADTDDGMEFHI